MRELIRTDIVSNSEAIAALQVQVKERMLIEFGNELCAHQVSMACHELAENACKYSVHPLFTVRIEVEPGVRITVRNIASRGAVEAFVDALEDIAQCSPEEGYQKRALMSAVNDGIGGIGLARLRYEVNAQIMFTVDDVIDTDIPDDAVALTIIVDIPFTGKEA